MATLSQYKTYLTEKLGTSANSFFTAEMRLNAINYALNDLYNQYDIAEITKSNFITGTIGSDTYGLNPPMICDFPTDYGRMVKLWRTSIYDASMYDEFDYVDPDVFDQLNYATGPFNWTEDYELDSSTRKLMLSPSTLWGTSGQRVHIRYIQKINPLVNDTDESGLSTSWDDCVAYRAAQILLENAKDKKADTMRQLADSSAAQAYGGQKNRGGVKGGVRLKSHFEKRPLINN